MSYYTIKFLHHILTLKHRYRPDTNDTRQLSPEYNAFETVLSLKPTSKPVTTTDPHEIATIERQQFTMGQFVPASSSCIVEPTVYNDVTTYYVYGNSTIKQNAHNTPFIMYVHGGSFMLGDINSHKGFECELSLRCNMPVLHIEYRRTPEHPLPTCVDDTVAVYKALLKQDSNVYKRICVAGDSAGGCITQLFLQRIIRESIPVPQCCVLISPRCDMSATIPSYQYNDKNDIVFNTARSKYVTPLAFGGIERYKQLQPDLKDITYSPVYASYEQFPSTLIIVGTYEIFYDDIKLVYNKLKQASIDVQIHEQQYMWHDYTMWFQYFPEANKALSTAVQFITHQFTT